MRADRLSLACAFVLAGVLMSPAQAEGSWTAPGWYVEETSMGFDETLVSGPYADEAQCKAALPANTDDYDYDCNYEGTDPSASEPPIAASAAPAAAMPRDTAEADGYR